MKQLIIIFTSLFLALSTYGQKFKTTVIDGIVNKDTVFVYPKQYDWENHQGFVKDSLPNGRWVAYFDDSVSIAFIGHYKNGKPNGLFQFYFKNGRIRHTSVYKDGVENGPFTYWNKDGTISMQGQKVDDKKDGVWYEWWSDGNLRKYSIWKNNNQHGIYKYYYPDGTLNRIGNYSNGYQIGEWLFYHKNGQLNELQYFVDSISLKEEKVISENKNTFASIYFPINTWKELDENGNLISEIFFNDSHGIDRKITYFPSGSKKEEINFERYYLDFCSHNPRDFIINGLYQEWYENGKLKTKGNWKKNQKSGEWLFWSLDGEIEKIEVYHNGKLINKNNTPQQTK